MDKERKNELIVGSFTLVALFTLIVMIFAVNKLYNAFDKKNHYYVNFRNVGQLEGNAMVYYSGFDVGKVETIELCDTDVRPVMVGFWLPADIRLRASDSVSISTKGLMGAQIISIMPNDPNAAILAEGSVVNGVEPLEISTVVDMVGQELAEIGVEVKGAFAGVNRLVSDPTVQQEVKATVVNADSLLDTLNGIATQNEADIRNTIRNISAASNDVPSITANLRTVAAQLDETAAAVRAVAINVDELTSENRENINKILLNLTTTSEHIKGFAAEIEANPWRLVRRPSNPRE